MQRRRTRAATASVLGLALIAAACGSDVADQAATTTAGGGAASTTASSAGSTTSSTAAVAQPTSIEDWEALWAEEREAIIQRIEENGWGKSADGKTLTGPGGWTVDLTKCPAGWSDTEGVSDTAIEIGQSIPLSGTYADYGNLGRGIEFLFDHYSDEGLFEDTTANKTRRVEYVMTDDG